MARIGMSGSDTTTPNFAAITAACDTSCIAPFADFIDVIEGPAVEGAATWPPTPQRASRAGIERGLLGKLACLHLGPNGMAIAVIRAPEYLDCAGLTPPSAPFHHSGVRIERHHRRAVPSRCAIPSRAAEDLT